MLHTTITPIDELIDAETSIYNAMLIISRAEQIVDVLIYMGSISADQENATQLHAISELLMDAQSELFKGSVGIEH